MFATSDGIWPLFFATLDRERPNAVLGGRWWQDLLLDGKLPETRFADAVEGYCDQLRRIGSKDGKAARRALGVPIPYKLGGSTSYYLVLVTRSPKAVVLFSDAADEAISEAWRRREEEERLEQCPDGVPDADGSGPLGAERGARDPD